MFIFIITAEKSKSLIFVTSIELGKVMMTGLRPLIKLQ